MPSSSRLRDWFRQNTSIGAFANGRPGAGVAGALGSALGGPLLGYAAGKLANKWYDRRDRQNYVPGSPMPATEGNNAGLALGMTNWGGLSNIPQAGDNGYSYSYDNPASVGPPAASGPSSGYAQAPLMGGQFGSSQGSGGGIGHGWQVASDPMSMDMAMDALGMSGALGGGGPNIDSPMTWMRRAVK